MYPRKQEAQSREKCGPKNASTFQNMEPGNNGGDGAPQENDMIINHGADCRRSSPN